MDGVETRTGGSVMAVSKKFKHDIVRDTLRKLLDLDTDEMGPIWMILCKKCGASASFGMDGCDATQAETVDSWNRRAEMKRVIHAEV